MHTKSSNNNKKKYYYSYNNADIRNSSITWLLYHSYITHYIKVLHSPRHFSLTRHSNRHAIRARFDTSLTGPMICDRHNVIDDGNKSSCNEDNVSESLGMIKSNAIGVIRDWQLFRPIFLFVRVFICLVCRFRFWFWFGVCYICRVWFGYYCSFLSFVCGVFTYKKYFLMFHRFSESMWNPQWGIECRIIM